MERNAFYMIDAFWFWVSTLSTAINTIEHNGNKLVSYIAMFVYLRGGFQCQENESINFFHSRSENPCWKLEIQITD
jgi:hypothetical protein